jgi:hypothetical protein
MTKSKFQKRLASGNPMILKKSAMIALRRATRQIVPEQSGWKSKAGPDLTQLQPLTAIVTRRKGTDNGDPKWKSPPMQLQRNNLVSHWWLHHRTAATEATS